MFKNDKLKVTSLRERTRIRSLSPNITPFFSKRVIKLECGKAGQGFLIGRTPRS
jgi:hypothetical protein